LLIYESVRALEIWSNQHTGICLCLLILHCVQVFFNDLLVLSLVLLSYASKYTKPNSTWLWPRTFIYSYAGSVLWKTPKRHNKRRSPHYTFSFLLHFSSWQLLFNCRKLSCILSLKDSLNAIRWPCLFFYVWYFYACLMRVLWSLNTVIDIFQSPEAVLLQEWKFIRKEKKIIVYCKLRKRICLSVLPNAHGSWMF
jgi:hypothetical protein